MLDRLRLRQLFDAQLGFMALLSTDGSVLEINQTPLQFMGMTREEILGRKFTEVGWLQPGSVSSVIEAIATATATLTPTRLDVQAVFPSVGTRIVDSVFAPLTSLSGEVEEVLAYGIDVTDHRAAEARLAQALRDQERILAARTNEIMLERERFILSQRFANIGTWDWDIRTGALYWSETIWSLFGYPAARGETTYDNFVAALHPDDRPQVVAAVSACIERGAAYDIEHRIIRPDGTISWVSETGDVIRDEAGAPLRMLGVVQDITLRRKTEERLRHTQKMEALGNLSAGVAHNLNNLLLPILALSTLIADAQPEGSANRMALDKVIDASQRARKLVAQILSFGRMDQENLSQIDLRVPVSSVADLFKSSASPNLVIELHLPQDPVWVTGDPAQLEVVVLNLVTNAMHAIKQRWGSSRGTIGLQVATQDRADESQAILRISDDGIGMTDVVRSQAFDPFFTSRTVGEGLGLGLSVVHGIVRKCGGKITLDSAPGQGTVVQIEFPLTSLRANSVETPVAPPGANPEG